MLPSLLSKFVFDHDGLQLALVVTRMKKGIIEIKLPTTLFIEDVLNKKVISQPLLVLVLQLHK
jgi:hypothetical protein